MKKITVTKKELQDAYNDMAVSVAAAHFGVCVQKFYEMIDSVGIERKRKGFKRGENVSFEIVG